MPMESLWELGAIHRAAKWQSLNISVSRAAYIKAKGFKDLGGGEYKYGDAPILDQLKMVNDAVVLGKVALARQTNTDIRNVIYGSLFNNMPIRVHGNYLRQGLDRSGIEDSNAVINSTETEEIIYPNGHGNKPDYEYDALILASTLDRAIYGGNGWDGLYSAEKDNGSDNGECYEDDKDKFKYRFFRRSDLLAIDNSNGDILFPIRQVADGGQNKTDAQEEQIIGRFINLVKVNSTPKKLKAIMIVQTLRDAGDAVTVKDWNNDGKIAQISSANLRKEENTAAQFQAGYRKFSDAAEDNVSMFANPPNGVLLEAIVDAQKGRFDAGADAITGETKVIIDLEFNQTEGTWGVVKYEYAE